MQATLSKYFAPLTFFIFLLIGLFIYKDYGISWDEEMQHKTGMVSYAYVFQSNDELFNYGDKDYGVAFELPLIMAEKIFGLTENKDIFLMRHLATHLLFLAGAWAMFLLLRLLFKNNLLSLIGLLLYLLHPRIYADSFYNTKDIPFLALYTICLYWSAKSFASGKIRNVIILGVFTGLLINIRIMGLMHLGMLGVFYFIDIIYGLIKKGKVAPIVRNVFILLFVTIVTLYISWPYLWKNPVENFASAWNNMAHFRWGAEVFLNGKYIPGTELPWYYAPYWFVITTPILYLILGIFGIISVLFFTLKNKFNYLLNCPERNQILAVVTFSFPFLAVIYLHSVIYDAWRQLFFVYPSFVVLAVWGISQVFKHSEKKQWLHISCLFLVCFQGIKLIKLHPFENLYFNRFVSKQPEQVRKYIEMDYWGLSFKQAFEYILAHDTSKHIKITYRERPCEANARILFPERDIECTRIPWDTLTPNPELSDYFITNYRMHPDDFENVKGKEIHSIIVNNSRMNTIFKLK